jgi:SNF2 family DNA or RNA helicase
MAKNLRSIKWDRVVADESHRIKSPSGAQSRYMSALSASARRRLALSGTPMPHSPLDIFAQYRFLDRTIYGANFHAFKTQYAIMGGFQNHEIKGYRNEDDLRRRFEQIAFRVGKEVLDLPEAVHITRACQLDAKTARMYAGLQNDFVAWVREGYEVTATNALAKLLRLQQLTGGHLPAESGVGVERVSDAKRDLLEDVLEDIAHDEPIAVFCRFSADLDVVHEVAKALGRESRELSGRANQLADWQAGAAPILAVQMQAGGVGIDLTRARYCVYYSCGFSLGDYEQSLARVHRPGQTRPVTYVHLVASGTVDEAVYFALDKRREVVRSVLTGIVSGPNERAAIADMQNEAVNDALSIFGFGEDDETRGR